MIIRNTEEGLLTQSHGVRDGEGWKLGWSIILERIKWITSTSGQNGKTEIIAKIWVTVNKER